MPDGQGEGLTDLERELTCSICTEILYQPLTLLDCLHTFCGSCLREWFAWQASRATTPHPYTCPSCRAPVRETRPNATVTTLLDVLLKAHPDKQKPQKDKDEIAQRYKPGDNVVPPVKIESDSEDSEDQRVLEQARELSLREVDPERARRRAERSAHQARIRRRTEREQRAAGQHTPEELGRAQQHSRFLAQSRPLEHQSSLRSILSASDVDSEDMQEEIRRQIIDDGLLDDVDLNNMTREQEEEITERIALAFQRQQQERSPRPGSRRRQDRSPRASDQSQRRREQRPRSRSTNSQRQHNHPPLSRPHLLGVATDDERRQHGRSSSQSSQRSGRSANQVDAPIRAPGTQPASRSVTDLSSTSSSELRETPRHVPRASRTATDPERPAGQTRPRRARTASRDGSAPAASLSLHDAPRRSQSPRSFDQHPSPRLPRSSPTANDASMTPRPSRHLRHTSASDPTSAQTAVPASHPRPSRPALYTSPPPRPAPPPPSISCSRCHRPDIQYSLHYTCSKCDHGDFHLCLSCHRTGRGCKYWFGFGYAASIRFHRSELPSNAELPHILLARKYQKQPADLAQASNGHHHYDDHTQQPSMEQGLFCDGCLSNANRCYWHCDICNDGAWGYCAQCVQRGLHCTHPLEAMTLKSLLQPDEPNPNGSRPSTSDENASQPTLDPSQITTPPLGSNPDFTSLSIVRIPSLLTLRNKSLPHVPDPNLYAPLLLPCDCDICHRAIPSSAPRYHCPVCPDGEGDYDVCTSCYNALVSAGKISTADGPTGWRRCPRGHRMAVIGFEERERGLRRVVLRDLVGGLALKEENGATVTPSDGMEGQNGGHHHQQHQSQPHAAPRDPASKAQQGRWRWRETDGSVASADATVPRVNAPDPAGVNGGGAVINVQAPTAPQQQPLLPPDGGVGLRVQALWSYFPAEGVRDELAFPRNAEIREAEDINGDWFWGVYAGRKGLFPGTYGRVVNY